MSRFPEPESSPLRSGQRRPVGLLVAAISWLGIALALYRPFLNRPYDVQDLPELLPMIRQSSSALEAMVALSEYLLSHGRLNLAIVAQLVLKWELLGESMALWHLVRAGEMCLLATLVYLLLRRLGCTRPGAFAGSTVVLASPPAVLSWTRMAIGEPTGAIVLVLLCLLLLRAPGEHASGLRYVGLCVTVMVLGLIKEVLLVAVPVVTLGLIGFEAGAAASISLFLRDRRVHAVVLGGILVSVPIVYAALQAQPQGYSSLFGLASLTVGNFIMPLLATLIPFAPSSGPLSVIEVLAIVGYIAGMFGALGVAMRDRSLAGRGWLLLLGLGLPVAGALVYAPWPKYRLYHALPFQLGTALLIGIAVSRLLKSVASVRLATCAALALIAAPMLTFAHGYLSFTDATRALTRDTALWLGRLPHATSATVEICGLPRQHFSDYDYFLRSYALSLGLTPPPVSEAPCVFESPSNAFQPGSWRVMLSDRVPQAGTARTSTVYRHATIDLRTLRFLPDSIIVTTWPPA